MGIVFGGQAFGGIFASVTQVLVILLGVPPSDAAFFCFLVAVVFLATALICFVIATRSKFFQFYVDEKPQNSDDDTEDLKGKFLQNEIDTKPQKVSPWYVLKAIWVYAFSVFLIFTVTLACFPAITAIVKSSSLPKNEKAVIDPEEYEWGLKYFIPVACFVLFNVGDWLGRFMAEMIQWPKPGRFGMWFVFVLSILRIGFVPLFLFCNANPDNRNLTWVIFDDDIYYIIIMSLFSLSNGYLSSICMMSAPQLCKGSEAQTAASMMVALLGLGLGTGSLTSNLVQRLL